MYKERFNTNNAINIPSITPSLYELDLTVFNNIVETKIINKPDKDSVNNVTAYQILGGYKVHMIAPNLLIFTDFHSVRPKTYTAGHEADDIKMLANLPISRLSPNNTKKGTRIVPRSGGL